ncbi:PI-PLC X domain-containing protein 3 isoform X2 [Eurytemora carolleeae]|uniref:PI-PLC X domain-containing protein 3 isoform X2 n=1 Tax=Eurytemora carolleeae TaxID=1294199 RepID=UPI000C768D00|nr:PI-PLC X domain-containing protein 3 isoform X2 [Eurytemora carolleeae]|eukprot:XP_023333041.1 PI-PLC X domain-containing protein 3-like isoform X2 [Eurytemora affinis]
MMFGFRRRESDAPVPRQDWMTRLPEKASSLCIPGSHDSFTSSLVPGCIPGPDQPELIRKLAKDFPRIAQHILYRWSFTQHKDVVYQLENGIRYFDIRLVAVNDEFVIIHCLFGEPIQNILSKIKLFLQENPGEIVILDFQHLYNFTPENNMELENHVKQEFGESICPCPQDPGEVSLDFMNSFRFQVICFHPRPISRLFWPRYLAPNPWANTTSSAKLKRFLTKGLDERPKGLLFISQGVFTPQLSTIIFHCFSDLEHSCTRRCNRTVRSWLNKTRSKPNIVITDFVLCNKCSCDIINKIIRLNQS